MAADITRILSDLLDFYDFAAKRIIAVGAGGGQLAEYGRSAAEVIAVDVDPSALEQLGQRLGGLGLDGRFTLRQADFLEVADTGDVVVFELSLHEMADPGRALDHAARLAPDVVVLDHAMGSSWAYHVVEEGKVANAWAAVVARGPARLRTGHTTQRFASYDELVAKVSSQGELAIQRATVWQGRTDIVIPLGYSLALIPKRAS